MPIARKFARIIPRHQRPNLTWLIIEKIGEFGLVLLDSFFPAKYPEARLWRKILGLDSSYEFKRPTFATILSHLKSQGLVENISKQGKWYWRLTTAGRAHLARRQKIVLPRPDGRKRLVCFDIPERESAKRRWLRGELIACGYRRFQKSVWLGDAPLPQEFIDGLDTLNLRGQVHIFLIEGQGTLLNG